MLFIFKNIKQKLAKRRITLAERQIALAKQISLPKGNITKKVQKNITATRQKANNTCRKANNTCEANITAERQYHSSLGWFFFKRKKPLNPLVKSTRKVNPLSLPRNFFHLLQLKQKYCSQHFQKVFHNYQKNSSYFRYLQFHIFKRIIQPKKFIVNCLCIKFYIFFNFFCFWF